MRPLILLVNEGDRVASLAAELASSGSFEVALLDPSASLLYEIRTRQPRLVILPWSLPTTNGTEIELQLAADPRTRSVGLIFVDSEHATSLISQGVSLPAVRDLPELDFSRLIAALRAHGAPKEKARRRR